MGEARSWGDRSVANIIREAGSEVVGYALALKLEHIKKLDVFEGYPDVYNRLEVQLKLHSHGKEDQFVNGLAYEMVHKDLLRLYSTPCDKYLDACCKTLSTSLFLK